MTLAFLLQNVVFRWLCGACIVDICDIIYDSEKVVPGCVFVCIKGQNWDGHDFVDKAIAGGCRALVISEDHLVQMKEKSSDLFAKNAITVVAVKNTREALGEMSRAFFGFPERKLTMIGITGTKGKTTTAFMMQSVLSAAGIQTGMIGTVGVFTGKQRFSTENTTPASYIIQKYLQQMVSDGCQAAVLEVSSQGMMHDRVAGVQFDYGIFTNISPDHIGPGEHENFQDYLFWKSRLFLQCQTGIINGTDKNIKNVMADKPCAVETFGDTNADLTWRADDICIEHKDVLGIKFKVKSQAQVHSCGYDIDDDRIYTLSLPGRYNVMNALPVIAVARHMHLSGTVIAGGLAAAHVSGRCEVLTKHHGGYVILDYAHNGIALENVLKTLREYAPKRLICIFGCGGNRSGLRRMQMAKAAVLGADILIITSDNPRYEPPEQIIHDILEGIENTRRDCPQKKVIVEVFTDRRAAIARGIEMMKAGDFVLLAGKGHEMYQEIKGKRYPFDEHEIVENYCQENLNMIDL